MSDLSEAIIIEFKEHFMTLEISKIIEITFETYGMFTYSVVILILPLIMTYQSKVI